MIDSISRRDYPVVQSGLLLIAGLVMVVNLLVDLAYSLLDPRIAHLRIVGRRAVAGDSDVVFILFLWLI